MHGLPLPITGCVSNIYLPFKQINGLAIQPPFPFDIANLISVNECQLSRTARDVPAQPSQPHSFPKINYLWNTFPNRSSPVMRGPTPPRPSLTHPMSQIRFAGRE
ncbi:hypothetical protein CDAR_212171 [Caerostris darwini]|uniref:Uncharacterized protein n=1 Tax=Caerostris darwini TaxID=1538125 RepID=A0AAV4NV16_9ARAC|nr:hypothetical protein CDAR_212171 [Caerostris darwini]